MRKRHENVDINSFLLHGLGHNNYKNEYIKLPGIDVYELENCVNCGVFLTKIDEKKTEKANDFEQIIEIYECKKCGYLYEFSLKVTKNH